MEVILGANQVNRENGKRRVVVTANVRGRDLGSFVQDIQVAIKSKVKLPASYWIEYGGTYQKLQSASERLSIVVPVTLVLIVLLLFLALGSIKDSLIIFQGFRWHLQGDLCSVPSRHPFFNICGSRLYSVIWYSNSERISACFVYSGFNFEEPIARKCNY